MYLDFLSAMFIKHYNDLGKIRQFSVERHLMSNFLGIYFLIISPFSGKRIVNYVIQRQEIKTMALKSVWCLAQYGT